MQQLTCNNDLSRSFSYSFFSFVPVELKPSVLKGKVPGEKFSKSAKKCENSETILPFSCCPLFFSLNSRQGSEKVLGRVPGKGFLEGGLLWVTLRKGSEKGSQKRF